MEEAKLSTKQITSAKSLDYIISGTLFLIFLLCPWFFTGLVAQGIGFEKMVLFYFLVLLGIVVWVTKGVVTGELNLKRTPLDWPIIGVIVIFIISTILSVNQKDSLIGFYGNSAKGLAALVVFALFYYLLVNNINTRRIKLLFWALVSSSSLVIIYSLLQLSGNFILPIDFTKAASFNPLGSLSSLTMFLVIVLPILTIAMAQIKEIHPELKNKILLISVKVGVGIITMAGLAILVMLTGFTFWPAAIVGIVIVLMFFLSRVIKITNNNLLIPLAVFLVLIILLVLGNFNIASIDLPAEVSLSRRASWDIAKSSLVKDPIFGSGPSTFYYNFARFKGIDFNASPLWNVRFDSASGILFELMANVGSLGTLAIIIVILIALSICFLTLIKTNKNDAQPILLALFASFISVIIFSLLFSLNNSLILISVIVACFTLSIAIVIYPEKFKTVNLSFRASPKYALALAAIFLCVSAGVIILFTMGLKMYLADIYNRQSLVASDTNEKIIKLTKAVQLAPYQDNYYLNLANHYMTLANQEARGDRDQVVIENNLSLAIERGKRAIEIAPNKASNNEALALIYENASFYVRGALEWAENLYNKVIELDPDSPAPYLRIALINMARANAETEASEQEYYINEAIKKYDEAINKKGDLASAHYGKAIAYERLANTDDAIEQLKRAVILARNNLDYRFELGRLYFNRGVSQPNIAQTAAEDITKGEDGEEEELSVETSQATGSTILRSDDLNMAEQIFLSILQVNPNNANALYSLALIYQKVGERDNAKIAVTRLLGAIADEATQQAIKNQFPGLY